MHNSSSKSSTKRKETSYHHLLLDQLDGYIKKIIHPTNNLWTGALVVGKTGAGKTFLIENYLKSIPCEVLISSQSQQLQNVPYAGLKLAIGNYLRLKFKELDSQNFLNFSEGLTEALGEDFTFLSEYIPELKLLQNNSKVKDAVPVTKIENQLYALFKTLFEYFSDFSNQVLILFMDDLQWVDGSSANLLQYLLTQLPPSKLIWIGAVRDSKEDLDQVDNLIRSLGFDQKHIQRIELGEFDLDQSRLFIEECLRGSCEKSAVSLIHTLGKGNPALLINLIDALVQEKLLHYDGQKWVGDLTLIKKKYEGINSSKFYSERLNSLASEFKHVLEWVACAEIIRKRELVELCSFISDPQSEIEKLIIEGTLSEKDEHIEFAENNFGEFIYSRLPQPQKSSYHFQIAQLLLKSDFFFLSNSEKVIIAQHLYRATENIKNTPDKIQSAAFILEVAKIQKSEQAYSQAKVFLNAALALLKGLRWEEAGMVLFQAHLESARIEYLLGEYDLAEIKLDYLIENLIALNLRSEAFELKIIINNHLGRYRKAVAILQEILDELGLVIPSLASDLANQIQDLQVHVETHADIPLRLFQDQHLENQEAVLRLLYVGGMALHHTSEKLMTWAALQLILRSRYFELPKVSAIGYVSYARMQVISGNITGGYELGNKGVTLNANMNDLQYRCRVLGVFAFYIQPWKRPFEESRPLLIEGMEAGRKSGDVIGLYILKTHLFNLHFISGKPLSELLGYDFKESYPGMELTYYITHYQKELIRYLTTESPFLALPKQEPGGLAAKLTLQEELFYRNYILARYYFLFGYFDLARISAYSADQNKKLQQGSPLVPANTMILSLSITQNWQNFTGEEKKENLSCLEHTLQELSSWYHHASLNYGSDFWLLRAEVSRITGQSEANIIQEYKEAISCAGENLYQTAICHELLGKYYLTKKNFFSASDHFRESVNFFERWGARRKVRQLVRQYSFLFEKEIKVRNPLDVENILRELGGEMDANLILTKLLTILLRVSASSGASIQLMENQGQLKNIKELQLLDILRQVKDPENAIDLSSLFLMAYRTKSPLVFKKLGEDSGFPELKILKNSGIKSFMIFPVGISESLTMLIYLESKFVEANYTDEIVRWVRIISSQGGIILENARIYEKSLLLNEEVKQEVEKKEALMSLLEEQKNTHFKDLFRVQEHERERIAGDLHDSLGSQLSTIKIRLANLFEKSEESTLVKEGHDALHKLDEAIAEVRRIAHHMSPVSLRKFGLSSALQSLIEDISESTSIQAELQILGIEDRLEEQIELTVYRICQELLQNIIKHSQADRLRLQLINHQDFLNITVEDNGVGIQKDRVNWGMGLLGIETKVQMLNGTFSIESQPKNGCLLVIDFPIGNKS
ncbi:AAA family ATPase [Algoriphagus aestuarii]|nr:AAA family ATPase [Algoriphagus aestuarii]